MYLLREVSFNLIFPDDRNLIKLKDFFLKYNPKVEDKYQINIVMERAEFDLDHYLEKHSTPISLDKFFPILKHSLTGLTFLAS